MQYRIDIGSGNLLVFEDDLNKLKNENAKLLINLSKKGLANLSIEN